MGGFRLTYQIRTDTEAAKAATERLEAQAREFFGLAKSGAESTVPASEQAGDAIKNKIGGGLHEAAAAQRRWAENVRLTTERLREERPELILHDAQLRLLSSSLEVLHPAFQALAADFENLRGVGSNALTALEQGMASSIAQAIVYAKSVGDAMAQALKSIAASIASEAILQALKAAALGFLRLAEYDVAAAEQAFQSAAIWGLVGGAAAGIGGAIPGGTATVGATRLASRHSSVAGLPAGEVSGALAPGAAAAPPAAQLTVLVMGPDNAAQWLANNVLNPYTGKGGTLVASHTRRPPYAGR